MSHIEERFVGIVESNSQVVERRTEQWAIGLPVLTRHRSPLA